ncbi:MULTISPECIES: hypothetical protein [unclassified Vibrio]|uniref:hypothetical protein n=1 Tax=unclassified Vibrio TaxID=2614977 RepID=UPI001360F006|nr:MULTISPECIES: hypothetical protein [unclassified Vibrio]NAW57759.1 hypothetical protein [Vibrio sp. V36_P2S2PM302]NAX28424.1 hypothetical protein [Vibrio sp. V38_P2S17PM301]NAX29572.1 hypothetical protein [Vibrio sp. V37_P2S8PM304]
MKYANQEKNTVVVSHPNSGQQWTVPRGHRFWSEWGIDTAEQEGRIDEPETIDANDATGGSSVNAE